MRYPQWAGTAQPVGHSGTDTGFSMDYLLPALLGLQLDIVLSAVAETGTSNYFLQLEYKPSAMYWNPYSVRLNGIFNGNPPSFTFNTNALSGNQMSYQVMTSSGASETLSGPNPIYLSGPPTVAPNPSPPPATTTTTNDFTFSIDPASISSMDSGEVRFFGLDANVQNTTQAGSVALALPNLKSNPNVSQDFYVSYLIKSGTGTGSFPGTDSVQISGPQSVGANRLSQNIAGTGVINGWPDSASWSGRYNNSGLPFVNPAKNATGGTAVWPNPTVQSLASNPIRIVGYYARTKGLISSQPAPTGTATYKYISQGDDVAMFMGNAMEFLPTDNSQSCQLMELYAQAYDPYSAGSLELSTFAGNTSSGLTPLDTYYGAASLGVIGSSVGNSPKKTVLYDIPTQPMVSLGQFMHLEPRYYNDSGAWGHLQFPAMAIGGGLASPDVSLNVNNNTAIAASHWQSDLLRL